MPTLNLGQVRPVQRGDWDAAATYQTYDWVHYNGSAYLALQHVPENTEPDSHPDVWTLFGARGADGRNGVDGVPGAPGEQGIQGMQGERGEQGIQGPQGEQEPHGPQGIPGPQGEKGDSTTLTDKIDRDDSTVGASAKAVKKAYDAACTADDKAVAADAKASAADAKATAVDAKANTADAKAESAIALIKASGILAGSIFAFSGSFGGSDGKRPIPLGSTLADETWALCDGTNGTPNLCGRFVYGAGNTILAGSTGGIDTHAHTLSGTIAATTLAVGHMPSHTHSMTVGGDSGGSNGIGGSYGGGSRTQSTHAMGGSGAHTHSMSGSIAQASNLPPYYALAYIMKLPTGAYHA